MNKKNRFQFFISCLLFFLLISNSALAITFDPNFIISDEEILDRSSMSLSEIENFLRTKGGYISNHNFKNADGVYKSAAEIIYESANNFDCKDVNLSSKPSREEKLKKCKIVGVNPKLLIVLLQKEQSLIDEKSPTQRQLDWATGYGCPDGGGCNPHWKGFGKQVNSASLQFYDYMENPQDYSYKAGETYNVTNSGRDSLIVRPQNQATAALYNYTPHVYNGNFNFFKLWIKYFTRTYPNGTLLQAKGEAGVWLIQNGEKRPFLSKGALTSRFDPKKIVQINKSDLDVFPTGKAIKFPQYSLVRSPRGTVFLLIDDQRRGFADGEALRKIGINPEEIVDASWDDINIYKEGSPITATSSYPTGALLQDNSTGGIYYVSDGTKAPLWDASLLKTKFKWKSITPVSPKKLASFKTVKPAIFNDGELLTSNISPAVYVIDNKKKRPIISGKIFEKMGYKWENIISVPTKILDLYPEGEPMGEIYSEEDLEINEIASSSPEIASTTLKNTSSSSEELSNEINNILNP